MQTNVYSQTGGAPQNPYYSEEFVPSAPPPSFYPPGIIHVEAVRIDSPSQSYLTSEMHEATLKLLEQADQISSRILNVSAATPRASHSKGWWFGGAGPSQPIYNLDFSDRSWGNKETHIHQTPAQGKKNEEKKDDSGTRILFGVIGFVAMAVTAYFTGKATAEGDDAADEVQAFETSKALWNQNKTHYQYKSYSSAVDSVVSDVDKILQREKANRTHKLALLIFAFMAGSAAVIGAVIRSKAFRASAVVVGSITVVAALFKLGYTCFSNRDKNDANHVQMALKHLNGIKIKTKP